MCGITGYFARESSPDAEMLHTLFQWGEKRGTDGFGLVLVKRSRHAMAWKKWTETYTECQFDVMEFLAKHQIKVGDLILAISRAAPEQEPPTTTKNMQPIVAPDNGCVLVHNGSVSNMIYEKIKCLNKDYKWTTQIDSEAIVSAYDHFEYNIKKAMEFISGGVAALMYDETKDCLYVITDFKPIAHGYIRGQGYILASDNDAIGDVIQRLTGCIRDGICLWEDWYHHYLSGGRIKEIDLDSGFVKNIKYSPRFITQSWDSNERTGT